MLLSVMQSLKLRGKKGSRRGEFGQKLLMDSSVSQSFWVEQVFTSIARHSVSHSRERVWHSVEFILTKTFTLVYLDPIG